MSAVKSICDFLLNKAADGTLAIGPLTWQPSDGTSAKQWYFIVGSGDESGQFHCDQISVDHSEREALRNAVLAELVSRSLGHGLVIHTLDDEITFAQWCERLWPCEKIARIRQSVEAEYASRRR
jgi:hypothetical protein